jgi:alkyl hydroperoxide reductase subunit AhpC
MLSDRSGKLSRAMGTYVADQGLSVRASFVVDPEGKIIAYDIHDESIGRSAAELLRKLQAAIAVREHEGDFCPAAWNPGDEMIKAK